MGLIDSIPIGGSLSVKRLDAFVLGLRGVSDIAFRRLYDTSSNPYVDITTIVNGDRSPKGSSMVLVVSRLGFDGDVTLSKNHGVDLAGRRPAVSGLG